MGMGVGVGVFRGTVGLTSTLVIFRLVFLFFGWGRSKGYVTELGVGIGEDPLRLPWSGLRYLVGIRVSHLYYEAELEMNETVKALNTYERVAYFVLTLTDNTVLHIFFFFMSLRPCSAVRFFVNGNSINRLYKWLWHFDNL